MQSKPQKPPFVSVVMPVRNETDFIERSLGAILSQNYPHDRMEVIIADGNSTDDTRELIANLARSTDILVRIVENPQAIAPTGLNAAIKRSKGEIIVRVDGHTIIVANYVSRCVFALLGSEACNVGGRMNAVSINTIGEAVAAATSSPFGVGNARFHYSEREEFVDTVYLGAWRREMFEKYGLFDEELVRNQDDEFNYRLRAGGERILLDPKIKSEYYNRSSWRKLWKQYFQYGFWKVRVLQKHPAQMQWRQFVPFSFVASVLSSLLLSFFTIAGLWLLGGILSLYLLANFAATIKLASRIKLKPLLLIPVSFAILHFSYGLGFIAGLIAFSNKWRATNNKQATDSV